MFSKKLKFVGGRGVTKSFHYVWVMSQRLVTAFVNFHRRSPRLGAPAVGPGPSRTRRQGPGPRPRRRALEPRATPVPREGTPSLRGQRCSALSKRRASLETPYQNHAVPQNLAVFRRELEQLVRGVFRLYRVTIDTDFNETWVIIMK